MVTVLRQISRACAAVWRATRRARWQ